MKLKTVIYIIETSYGTLGFIALFGFVASFLTFKGDASIIAIIIFTALLILSFFLKLNLINIYLKRCKYPYEFLSVLEQLGLTKDIQINWSEDLINGPQKSQLLTQQFLADNNLKTEIGIKKVSLPSALIVIGVSIIGLIYFSNTISFKGKPTILIALLVSLIMGIYLWTKGKRQLNDNWPIVVLNEKGLLLNGNLYDWSNIKRWVYKDSDSDRNAGEIRIKYDVPGMEDTEIKADLNEINIDRIDLMLLLTHFKAKYS
jgi:hypothetical protein